MTDPANRYIVVAVAILVTLVIVVAIVILTNFGHTVAQDDIPQLRLHSAP